MEENIKTLINKSLNCVCLGTKVFRLTKIYDQKMYGCVSKHGDHYYYFYNSGLQNHRYIRYFSRNPKISIIVSVSCIGNIPSTIKKKYSWIRIRFRKTALRLWAKHRLAVTEKSWLMPFQRKAVILQLLRWHYANLSLWRLVKCI